MKHRKKVLILGGASYIGRHLLSCLGLKQAAATYHRNVVSNGVHFDSTSMDLSDVITTPQLFSHAVILLGDTKPDSCVADLERSNTLNVKSIKLIVDRLNSWRIKPIFASSECVFDGAKGNYIETDEVNPTLVYAKQKVEIENYIQRECREFLIIRLAKVFGAQRSDGTLFTQWLDAIERQETIRCAYNQVTSAIYVEDVVEAILHLMEGEHNGVFHVAGHKGYSKAELFEMLIGHVRKHKFIEPKLVVCSIGDFDLKEQRPLDTSMKPDKLIRATGIRLRDIEHICGRIVKTYFSVRPERVG